ncbi:sialin-like isoform X2 [Parasteatoda tepidariorum]|uniref:sialin-like isoform X2 n=2 Tax=Parasteatoda tepidariorum TaxID=114398 RepID=UPI00077F9D6E|nr:sialin-like isoform X2 [Parasteatoda tepidariorum]
MGSALLDCLRGLCGAKKEEEEAELVSSVVEDALRREDEGLNFFRRHVPIRYVLTFMGFLSFTVLNMMRVDISVGIVCMVNWKNLTDISEGQSCSYDSSVTNSSVNVRSDDEDGPFTISTLMQGVILAGYFYGLLATQYLGVILCERLSAKYLLLSGVFISSLCTVLVPAAAHSSGIGLSVVQIFKGAGLGIVIPAFNTLIGKWIPLSERFYSMCIIGSGVPFGRFLGTLISGKICKNENLGWSHIFYIFGGMGFIYCILWVAFIFESPLTHPYITYNEMIRILKSRVILPQPKTVVPWKYILKSIHVWAYFILGFSSYWVLSIYTTLVPTFLSTVLKFDIEMVGAWSSLPYVFELIFFIYSCVLNDRLKRVARIRSAIVHKWSIVVGLIGFAAFFLGLPFSGCDRVIAISCLVMAMAFYGIIIGSASHVPMALSPRYADKISVIMNTFGAITGIIPPTMMGLLTKEKRTMDEWQILFYITAAFSLVALLVFLIFGSSSVQEWDDPHFLGITDSEDHRDLAVEVSATPEGRIDLKLKSPSK